MTSFSVESSLIELIASLIENPSLNRIIVTPNESEAQEYEKFIRESTANYLTHKDILYIPGFFQAGVFRFESAKKIIAKRIEAAYHIHSHFPRIIICSINGLTRNFPPAQWVDNHKFQIKVGDPIDPDLLVEQLLQRVYLQVQRVEDIGEFAIRGSIVDFWTPGEKTPTRIEIFDDAVDKIRSFRITDQRSFQTLNEVTILPSREFVWPSPSELEKSIEKLKNFSQNS